MDRRNFLKNNILLLTGMACTNDILAFSSSRKNTWQISLAEWSLHKTLQKGEITNLDFPIIAKQEFGISIVEYVNQFFMDKAENTTYLNELLRICEDNEVTNHLIMCDNEGNLGTLKIQERKKTVENHYKWIHAAKHLGCKSIRVNAKGEGTPKEVAEATIDGLGRLGEYAAKEGINVLVENHGGHSSNGKWLSNVICKVGKENVGTLPDFGNFCTHRENSECKEEYDRYRGVKDLLPYAKGISAKSLDFDGRGNCIETDFKKMFKIMKWEHFDGIIGIEYGGNKLNETDGITATLNLINRLL